MPATIIYDADCGLCNKVKDAVVALDWLGTLRWLPQQDPDAARYGIPREELEKAVFLIAEGGTTHGWEAVKRIALRLPLTYLLAAAAVRRNPWAGLALAIVFSPLANPVGNILYDLLARNRYRFPGSTCAVPVWDNRSK